MPGASTNTMRHAEGETQKRQLKRRKIVEAAYAELAEVGFEGFRMRNVAQRAALDHATLHHYFAGRAEILSGVMEYIVNDLAVGQFGPSAEVPPDRRLEAHVNALLSQMLGSPEMYLVLAEIALRAQRNDEVRRVKATFDAEWRSFIVRHVRAAIEVGAFREDLQPETAANLIMSLVRGAHLTLDGDADASRPLFELLLLSFRSESGQTI